MAIVKPKCAVPIGRDLPPQTWHILGFTLRTGAGTVSDQAQPPRWSYVAAFGVGDVGMAAALADS
ncbi:hypothetical protein QQS21_002491 [Conoideocrella luteorostrata]|uniref:Uncharacterized protein n=1 Tax=Conoideocrella luteorostrata TaxID=1105319 RepID=A0AAJ0G161_9HYPO|nr:hypothetical protein QQS21_002491 [Conoideocrella luteorostrata]